MAEWYWHTTIDNDASVLTNFIDGSGSSPVSALTSADMMYVGTNATVSSCESDANWNGAFWFDGTMIINGAVATNADSTIDGGTFNAAVTNDNGTINYAILMDNGTTWLYGPDYDGEAIAQAADMKSGVANLGITGTAAIPAASDVRPGVAVDGVTGTLEVSEPPAAADVREGVTTGETVGSLAVPSATDVRVGVPVDDTVGTLVPEGGDPSSPPSAPVFVGYTDATASVTTGTSLTITAGVEETVLYMTDGSVLGGPSTKSYTGSILLPAPCHVRALAVNGAGISPERSCRFRLLATARGQRQQVRAGFDPYA